METVLIQLLIVLLVLCFIGLILCGYFLSRNESLCNFRKRLIMKDLSAYNKLPSYDAMLYSFKSFESFIK